MVRRYKDGEVVWVNTGNAGYRRGIIQRLVIDAELKKFKDKLTPTYRVRVWNECKTCANMYIEEDNMFPDTEIARLLYGKT